VTRGGHRESGRLKERGERRGRKKRSGRKGGEGRGEKNERTMMSCLVVLLRAESMVLESVSRVCDRGFVRTVEGERMREKKRKMNERAAFCLTVR
jgi:hypothetical protein